MPCYSPINAYMRYNASTGRNDVVLKASELKFPVYMYSRIDLPCGRCIGCRLERSRAWALRLVAEQQMHAASAFLTLTYGVTSPVSLSRRDCQLFLKRLRKKLDKPIRYYLCGEYGERTARPHYHCCLFGEDFAFDRQPFRRTAVGWLYTSQFLADVWGFGHCLIGDLTFESAAYVARYCLKKISGPPAAAHYAGREPEFALMSRRPGIGASWFSRFSADVFPADECVSRGKVCKPPRYYLKLLELADAGMLGEVKARRALAARPRESDLRLAAKQEFARLGLEARAALKEMGYD